MEYHKHDYLQFYFSGFIFSGLFFLMFKFLYAWSSPAWFIGLPNTTGYRFIISLEVFFLSCFTFFAVKVITLYCKYENTYYKIFFLSFSPVILFSILVLINLKLQFLELIFRLIDGFTWLIIICLAVTEHQRTDQPFRKKVLSVWFIYTTPQIALSCLAFFPIVHDYILVILRLIIFSAMSLFIAKNNIIRFPDNHITITKLYKLSAREKDVLELILAGKTNHEISDILFISKSTVKTHISNIFYKTGTRNRLEVAALCRKT